MAEITLEMNDGDLPTFSDCFCPVGWLKGLTPRCADTDEAIRRLENKTRHFDEVKIKLMYLYLKANYMDKYEHTREILLKYVQKNKMTPSLSEAVKRVVNCLDKHAFLKLGKPLTDYKPLLCVGLSQEVRGALEGLRASALTLLRFDGVPRLIDIYREAKRLDPDTFRWKVELFLHMVHQIRRTDRICTEDIVEEAIGIGLEAKDECFQKDTYMLFRICVSLVECYLRVGKNDEAEMLMKEIMENKKLMTYFKKSGSCVGSFTKAVENLSAVRHFKAECKDVLLKLNNNYADKLYLKFELGKIQEEEGLIENAIESYKASLKGTGGYRLEALRRLVYLESNDALMLIAEFLSSTHPFNAPGALCIRANYYWQHQSYDLAVRDWFDALKKEIQIREVDSKFRVPISCQTSDAKTTTESSDHEYVKSLLTCLRDRVQDCQNHMKCETEDSSDYYQMQLHKYKAMLWEAYDLGGRVVATDVAADYNKKANQILREIATHVCKTPEDEGDMLKGLLNLILTDPGGIPNEVEVIKSISQRTCDPEMRRLVEECFKKQAVREV